MADKIELEVKLQDQLKSARADFSTAKKAGATDKVAHSERNFNILAKQLDELTKITNPTKEQLNKINSLFGQLNKLLTQLGNAMGTVSHQTQENLKLLEAERKKRKEVEENLQKTNHKFSRQKDDTTGKYTTQLIKAEKDKIASKLTWSSGSRVGQPVKHYDSIANLDQASADKLIQGGYASVQEVKKLVAEEEKKQLEIRQAAKETLEQIENRIKEINQQATTTNPGDVVAVNAAERQNEVEAITGQAKTAQTAPENRPIEPSTSSTAEFEKIGNANNGVGASLGKAFKQFTIYAVALRAIKKAVGEAVSTIKELDKSLTEQAMVTGKTRKQTYELLSTYQQLAAQTGATTREVAELATQFMRQGKTTQEALTLTQAAMDAAKVAGISATDSVNYLTTALNGFQMSAEDAMSVSDKFAAIAANSATSYDEIATALSKVASQANLAGMSIDYTTALLAKGLETTREAPETMGTALKTVIARMREIKDYGETLSGDTDVNNVESQLAYVGIALRDVNGELRSTEDVLNDLGTKWDTLNSNQQAAVAKALAGTRQQSRLIAMMTDYERVIELQEISERSAGATLSQMSTYLEGMSAALNKVSIAWEQIVTAFSKSDVIIAVVNAFAGVLDGIGAFVDNIAGMLVTAISLAAIGLVILGNKMKEFMLTKQQQAIEIQINKAKREEEILDQKAYLKAKLVTIQEKTALLIAQKHTLEKLKQEGASEEDIATQQKLVNITQDELKTEIDSYRYETAKLGLLESQNDYLTNQDSILGTIQNGVSSLIAPLMMIITLWKTISGLISVVQTKQADHHKQTVGEVVTETWLKAQEAAASIISQLGPWGIPIAIAVVAALTGTALAVAAGASAINKASTQGTASAINDLSNEIYNLTEKARSIDTITDSYDKLDNKIIKTIADQKEMNSLLEKAADELSDEEKDIYNSLTRDEDKLNYLKNISTQSTNEANSKRQQQLNKLNNMSTAKRSKILTSPDNNDFVLVQSAMYAIANNSLYEYIDGIEKLTDEEEAHWKSVEKVTQALLEGVDATEAYNLANNPERIEELAKALGDLQAAYVDSNGANQITGVTDILSSDDYSLKEKVQAFKTAAAALKNTELAQSFADTYQDLATFSSVFDDTLLDWMDDMGMTADGINNLGSALNKLGYDTEEATKKLAELFSEIQDGESLGSAILDVFGLDEMNETYTKILNAYEAAVGTTLLDVGQNVQSLKSQINTFYETAQKWSSMSDSEKTSFLSDNSTLFAGKDGAELLKAFESGDYNKIQAALQNNQELLNKTEQRIKEIKTQLEIETHRAESDRNEATIQYLQEQLAELEDVENLYAASLEIRLEQEQAYLDKYKEYLQKQKDELTKSLEDRKDAYQKYFDAVNQTADDEDFEQKESTLMANITKLASSTSADAINQSAKLEQSLKDLEDERLKTLREQAQEKIMSNLDDQVSQINDKFDELLDSNQAMLAALTGQLDNPTEFVSSLISSKIADGATALEVQDYISGLSGTYGNLIGTDIFKNIQVEERNNSLVLNVAGQEVPLAINDQQSVYDAIMAALRAVGAI